MIDVGAKRLMQVAAAILLIAGGACILIFGADGFQGWVFLGAIGLGVFFLNYARQISPKNNPNIKTERFQFSLATWALIAVNATLFSTLLGLSALGIHSVFLVYACVLSVILGLIYAIFVFINR